MTTHHVAAVFDTRDQAAEAVRMLKNSAFSPAEFTVVARPEQDDPAFAEPFAEQARATESETGHGGAWAGTALGASIAGMVGLFSLALIPALPLLMVGGAAVGALAGDAISRFGSGQIQNERTQRILEAGGALVVVHTTSDERASAARGVFASTSPHAIATESTQATDFET